VHHGYHPAFDFAVSSLGVSGFTYRGFHGTLLSETENAPTLDVSVWSEWVSTLSELYEELMLALAPRVDGGDDGDDLAVADVEAKVDAELSDPTKLWPGAEADRQVLTRLYEAYMGRLMSGTVPPWFEPNQPPFESFLPVINDTLSNLQDEALFVLRVHSDTAAAWRVRQRVLLVSCGHPDSVVEVVRNALSA
jgi:hypothetical protein